MANELFGFEWRVAAGGYKWIEQAGEEDPIGVKEFVRVVKWWGLAAEAGGRWKTYQPLEKFTGLYQEFADLEPTKEAILDFAAKYGQLGTDLFKDPPDELIEDELDGRRQLLIEKLDDWKAHILVMRDAVRVWDLLSRGEINALIELQQKSQLFTSMPEHRENEVVLFDFPHTEETLADVQHREDDRRKRDHPSHPPGFNARTALESAKTFVMNEVNAHLIEHGVTARLQPDALGEPRFYIVPRTLLGAMWLQFAEAISQQKEYRRCRVCDTPFEISTGPTGARSDKRFCQPTCRTEFHNQKRREVRALRAKGHSLQDIAKQYDTDIPTVRKWLGEPKVPAKPRRRR